MNNFSDTQGHYGICRNPMLLGVFIYHVGVFAALLSIGALIVFMIEVLIINVQVKKEVQRLKEISEKIMRIM